MDENDGISMDFHDFSRRTKSEIPVIYMVVWETPFAEALPASPVDDAGQSQRAAHGVAPRAERTDQAW
jgi:hypothetical protein